MVMKFAVQETREKYTLSRYLECEQFGEDDGVVVVGCDVEGLALVVPGVVFEQHVHHPQVVVATRLHQCSGA